MSPFNLFGLSAENAERHIVEFKFYPQRFMKDAAAFWHRNKK